MLSPLTKSESDSEVHRPKPFRVRETERAAYERNKPNRWRLRRTLKRRTEFRPIETDDIKYLWAAYKSGGLPDIEPGKSPDEFRETIERGIVERCHAAWTLFADTKRGFIPVGIVLAAWAPNAPYLIVTGISWMPWATRRNIVECTVAFFNKTRREFSFVGYATPEHKRMYEVCAMHGIMRRVGTSYVAIPGKACAVFETRAPEQKQ